MTSSLSRVAPAAVVALVVAAAVRLWNQAGGRIDQGLIERRECESDLLLYGCYRAQGGKCKVAA